MVSIQINQGQGFAHHCGGSVIESNLVLTAAHCLYNQDSTNLRSVFGTGDLSLAGSYRTERKIKKIILHPKYKHGESYYDVAVAVLEEEIEFNEGITKICLPSQGTMDGSHRFGRSATLTGWGATKPGGQASQELGHAKMSIFATSYCNRSRTTYNNQNAESDSSLVPNLFQSPVFCAGKTLKDKRGNGTT